MVSTFVLHHLPDFWKLVGLKNVWNMLKPDGLFYLADLIYTFPPDDYEKAINEMIGNFTVKTEQDMSLELVTHIKEEFSTFDWLMEPILERAGFVIEEKIEAEEIRLEYICRKVS